jgi:hypothetical protein
MEAGDASAGVRWHTLEWPAGPKFPPAYEPHGVKLIYDGEPVDLTPDQEEVASFYASLLDVLAPPIYPKICVRVACACAMPKTDIVWRVVRCGVDGLCPQRGLQAELLQRLP